MVFEGHVKTDQQGSEVTFDFEVPDAELAGKTPDEREDLINAECWELACNYIDTWWTQKEAQS